MVEGPYKGALGFTIFDWLLPYLEQGDLFDASHGNALGFIGSKPVHSYCNSHLSVPLGTVGDRQWLGSDNRRKRQQLGLRQFRGELPRVRRPVGASTEGATKFSDITDGLSNTLFIAERYANCCGLTGSLDTCLASLWSDSNRDWIPTFGMNGIRPSPHPLCTLPAFSTCP